MLSTFLEDYQHFILCLNTDCIFLLPNSWWELLISILRVHMSTFLIFSNCFILSSNKISCRHEITDTTPAPHSQVKLFVSSNYFQLHIRPTTNHTANMTLPCIAVVIKIIQFLPGISSSNVSSLIAVLSALQQVWHKHCWKMKWVVGRVSSYTLRTQFNPLLAILSIANLNIAFANPSFCQGNTSLIYPEMKWIPHQGN